MTKSLWIVLAAALAMPAVTGCNPLGDDPAADGALADAAEYDATVEVDVLEVDSGPTPCVTAANPCALTVGGPLSGRISQPLGGSTQRYFTFTPQTSGNYAARFLSGFPSIRLAFSPTATSFNFTCSSSNAICCSQQCQMGLGEPSTQPLVAGKTYRLFILGGELTSASWSLDVTSP